MSGRRTERLGEEIREEVAQIIASELKDPRIGFVTVTRVSLTADLRLARVYVGVLGDRGQQQKSLEGLRQASGFVRRELGRRIRARYTPEVLFEYDEGLEATDRVAQLLREAGTETPGSHGEATDESPDGPPRGRAGSDDEEKE